MSNFNEIEDVQTSLNDFFQGCAFTRWRARIKLLRFGAPVIDPIFKYIESISISETKPLIDLIKKIGPKAIQHIRQFIDNSNRPHKDHTLQVLSDSIRTLLGNEKGNAFISCYLTHQDPILKEEAARMLFHTGDLDGALKLFLALISGLRGMKEIHDRSIIFALMSMENKRKPVQGIPHFSPQVIIMPEFIKLSRQEMSTLLQRFIELLGESRALSFIEALYVWPGSRDVRPFLKDVIISLGGSSVLTLV